MAEFIDLDDKIVVTDIRGRERETTVRNILDSNNGTYHAADVPSALWTDDPISGTEFMTHNQGKSGFEIHFRTDDKAKYEAVQDECRRQIDHAKPAADVRPVVRAHWYWDKDGMDWGIGAWRCSACNTMSPMWWNTDKGSPMHKSGHKFCPNCGCAMEES